MPTEEIKICQNCKKEFTIEPEDFLFYERIKVPPPTFCPACRVQRRMAFLTDRAFYKRKCDATGQMIFSHFSAQAPVKVYDHDYWWSDKWDAMSYGRDYDFAKSFFEQFKSLTKEVPLSSRSMINLVRSDYSDHADNLKDCYLTFYASYLENVAYGVDVIEVKDSLDVENSRKLELCIDGLLDGNCYGCVATLNCGDCHNVWLSRDCVGCTECVGCANLKNKSYYIFNEKYTKEEYEIRKQELQLNTLSGFEAAKKKAKEIWIQYPHRFMRGSNNTIVSGDYIYHSKNAKNSYIGAELENVRYCQLVTGTKDSYDYTTWGDGAELLYECAECGLGTQRLKSCWDCWPSSQNLEYCMQCHSSSDLFGCIGLRKKQYCIFNKQYTKEEYESLVAKIKEQMSAMPYRDVVGRQYRYGEFFPVEFSPYMYHETKARVFFPLSANEIVAQGFRTGEKEKKSYQPTISHDKLPEGIESVQDDIVKEIISCSHCGGAFRIIPSELQIYRKLKTPLPRICPDCRSHERAAQRNPIALWKRTCMASNCSNEFETAYSPDRPETIYCETCYQNAVI